MAATGPGSHLIVELNPNADPRALEDAAAHLTAEAHLLFSHSRERLWEDARSCEEKTKVRPPDLSVFYRVRVPEWRLQEVCERLKELGGAEAAYVTPPLTTPTHLCGRLTPITAAAPVPTPDFSGRQVYLDEAAKGGVDARAAWKVAGGGGAGVEIIHIEGAWNFSHEDLVQNQGGVMGNQSRDSCLRQHGTAVLGVLGGDRGSAGVIGVCPDARVRGLNISTLEDPEGLELPTAIRRAANALDPGDIILVELQHPGTRVAFQPSEDRKGYVPPEWWPATLAAIRYATARGVILVEAAGNGDQDLDHRDYDRPDAGFPRSWKNPFNRAHIDSGAIVVGAGAPPAEPHGPGIPPSADHGPDRSRMPFSNYGSMVDVQAWGRDVTTSGFGSLQGGSSENRWYTDDFGGTSSATPIVAGVLACLQGLLKAKGGLLTPAQARELLRETGLAQASAVGRPATERIGNRPNLKELIKRLQ